MADDNQIHTRDLDDRDDDQVFSIAGEDADISDYHAEQVDDGNEIEIQTGSGKFSIDLALVYQISRIVLICLVIVFVACLLD